MELLERLIGFAIAMLILSLIVEKLTNLWKLYGPEELTSSAPMADRRSSMNEVRRAAKISAATLVVGVSVALLLRADAVQILSSPKPEEVVGWDLVFMSRVNFERHARLARTVSDHLYSEAIIEYSRPLRLLDIDAGEEEGVRVVALLFFRGMSVFFVALFVVILLLAVIARCDDPRWVQRLKRGSEQRATRRTAGNDTPADAGGEEPSDAGAADVRSSSFWTSGLLTGWFRGMTLKRLLQHLYWSAFGALVLAVVATFFAALATPGDAGMPAYAYPLAYGGLFIGVLLSGAAISFGSKFWHDVLDLLLQVKNLRRKLNDEMTYRVDRVEELHEFLELNDGELARQALAAHRDELKKLPGHVAAGIGTLPGGKRCVEVYNTGAGRDQLPDQLYVPLPSGKLKAVPLKVVLSEQPKAFALQPSERLAHSLSRAGEFGSVGCVVVKEDDERRRYLLTCYHVVKSDEHSYDAFQDVPGHYVLKMDDEEAVGRVVDAIRDARVDAALIQPYQGVEATLDIPGLGVPRKTRYLSLSEIHATRVHMYGAASKRQEGMVSGLYHDVRIEYGRGDSWEIEDLIAITSTSASRRFSQGGDSGSLVFDENGYVVGMIVAGTSKTSFAIAINTVLQRFHVRFPSEAGV